VVVTDIRMPPSGTNEGIQAADGCARTSRPSAWSCSASTVAPGYAVACWSTARRARHLAQGAGRRVDERPARSGRWRRAASVIAPRVVDEWSGPARSGTRARSPGSPRGVGDPREMGQGQEQRGHRGRADRHRAAVEKHTTRSSPSLACRGEGREPPGQGRAPVPLRGARQLTRPAGGWLADRESPGRRASQSRRSVSAASCSLLDVRRGPRWPPRRAGRSATS